MLRTVPVTHVAGVGRAKQKVLAALGLETVHDLLHHFPRRYDDRSIQTFESFGDGARVTALVVVEGSARVRWQGKRSVLTAAVRVDQRHRVTAVWFNQPYLTAKLTDGRVVILSGRYDHARNTLAVSHTEFETGTAHEPGRALVPVYSVTQGISNAQLQLLILQAFQQFGDQIEDILPHALREKYRLVPHAEAIRAVHEPDDAQALRQSHRRLAFEEFFLFQLQLQWVRRHRESTTPALARAVAPDALEMFRKTLPHPLTGAQLRTCETIQVDMGGPMPMSRLVQGDVGSGKTWVAFWAAYATYRMGGQTAFMAPTELLAEQHAAEAQRRLTGLGMGVALLTGSTPEAVRRDRLAAVASGEVAILVGTHALLTDDVAFARLGLVITDEQHRFGVSQRSALGAKGRQPDVLMLSATPIPRTLALAVYGDLDVSAIDELPGGRKPVVTRVFRMKDESRAVRLTRQEVARGHQAYVVAPLVEESEQMAELTSATALAERWKEQFAGFTVALLHGRMPARDKEAVMRSFMRGEVQVLVSTTVIEVGIDVPNATVMLIYHAERFGLAQLHQLRGRVGRGAEQSFCVLLSDAASEMATQRLQTMVETNDGFAIAERDLALRGPGEFLGVRQSGLPEFSVGDLARDFKVMEVARDEAWALIRNPDFWLLPQYAALRETIQRVPEGSYFKH